MNGRFLTHDVAWEMSFGIVRIFAGCLREEEQGEAFIEVYTRLKAGLEDFQERANRMQDSVRPGLN
jgi:hypothetical protein